MACSYNKLNKTWEIEIGSKEQNELEHKLFWKDAKEMSTSNSQKKELAYVCVDEVCLNVFSTKIYFNL